MQAEIDRVVAAGRTASKITARTTAKALATQGVRCAEFEGQRYCLGQGWTTESQSAVQSRVATEVGRVTPHAGSPWRPRATSTRGPTSSAAPG